MLIEDKIAALVIAIGLGVLLCLTCLVLLTWCAWEIVRVLKQFTGVGRYRSTPLS